MNRSRKPERNRLDHHIPELDGKRCTNQSRRRGKSAPMRIRLQRHPKRSARRGNWICVRRTSSHSTIREKLSFQSSNCKFNKNHFLKENPSVFRPRGLFESNSLIEQKFNQTYYGQTPQPLSRKARSAPLVSPSPFKSPPAVPQADNKNARSAPLR